MRWVWAALLALAIGACGGSKPKPGPSPTSTPTVAKTPKPKTDLASVARRAKVPVLCYHQIREQTAADSASDRAYIVGPKAFAQQMQALDDAGYTTVTGDQVVDHVAKGAPLPKKAILLTFDDASAGQYTQAFPVLKKHHFKATFFIMTVVLGKEGWLTRGQVRKLDRSGMTIGSHTWDHKDVTTYSGDDWQTEINAPTKDLEKLVGHRITLFAYPFGLHDSKAIPHLFAGGLRAAFQLAEPLDRKHPLWTLRRIIVPQVSGKELLHDIRADF